MISHPCITGCTACCGVIPWSVDEWDAVKGHPMLSGVTTIPLILGKTVIPAKNGKALVNCPFATTSGCAVYEKRPGICRLFGDVDDPRMKCPRTGGYWPSKWLTWREPQKVLGLTGKELAA